MAESQRMTIEVRISCKRTFAVAGSAVPRLPEGGFVARVSVQGAREHLLVAGTVHVRFPGSGDTSWLDAAVYDPAAVDGADASGDSDVLLASRAPLPLSG